MDEAQQHVGELIRRAREGDRACRDELFALCRNYLGFAAKAQLETWLQVKVDASDLVQQTMLEAHRDFERFQGLPNKMARLAATDHGPQRGRFRAQYRGTAKRQVGRRCRWPRPRMASPRRARAGRSLRHAQPGADEAR